MRDPARIRRILNKLEVAWLATSDTRLGQLLTCIGCDANTKDVWNLDDDLLEERIDLWLSDRGLDSG